MTRLHSPNIILHVGLSFFLIAAMALTQTTITTPHAMVALAMALGGLGLGLLLPNLTLIAQAITPRTQLGVATAMLQSMRIVGSMLGTALIGSLISSLYVSKVNGMLEANHGNQWASWLGDPQILVNPARASEFFKMAALAGHDAVRFLDGARNSLVDAIHASQWFIAAFMVLAFWLVHRIPAINIYGRNGLGS